jgi:catechol 2,3-dioxygenase
LVDLFNNLGIKYTKFKESGIKDAIFAADPSSLPLVFYYDMEYVGDLRLKFHLHRGIPPVRLAHVNVVIKDLSVATKFYVDVLRFMETEYFLNERGDKFVT